MKRKYILPLLALPVLTACSTAAPKNKVLMLYPKDSDAAVGVLFTEKDEERLEGTSKGTYLGCDVYAFGEECTYYYVFAEMPEHAGSKTDALELIDSSHSLQNYEFGDPFTFEKEVHLSYTGETEDLNSYVIYRRPKDGVLYALKDDSIKKEDHSYEMNYSAEHNGWNKERKFTLNITVDTK